MSEHCSYRGKAGEEIRLHVLLVHRQNTGYQTMLMLVHIVINSVPKSEKPRGPRLWIRLQGSNRLGVSRKAGNCRITEGDYIIICV